MEEVVTEKRTHGNTGKKFSEDHKRKIGEANKKRIWSGETKQKLREARKKQGDIRRGCKHSEESKQQMCESQKGNQNSKGCKRSEEYKLKSSKARKGKQLREKNPNWRGGISYEPYSMDWVETLKRAIRERDHYACQLCGALQGEKVLHIHHIDYNKKTCDPEKLITLCNKCHGKTNFNREKWIKYFYTRKAISEGGI